MNKVCVCITVSRLSVHVGVHFLVVSHHTLTCPARTLPVPQVLQQTFVIEAPAPKPAFSQKRRSTTSYGSLTSLDDGEQDARNSSYLHASMWPEAGKVMTEEEAKAWDAEVALIERRMHASMELAQMVQVRREPHEKMNQYPFPFPER